MSQSIMDYIFRRLALDYMPYEQRSALGIYTAEERQRYLETGSYDPIEETGSASELLEAGPEVEVRGAPSAEVARTSATSLETPEVVDADVVETKDSKGTEQREVPATETKQAHTSAELLEKITGTAVDSPLCFTCGTKMRPAGSCYVCEGCGSTSGCS